jgi:DNA-binding YbaB/EbfC family protein
MNSGGGKNMKNMNQMMKQVKKMQEQMVKAQEELGNKTVEGTAGGGVITVKANGHKKILDIQIKPEAVDPDDIDMLQDLILAAVNDAMGKADELANQDMGKFTGGMNMPGLF